MGIVPCYTKYNLHKICNKQLIKSIVCHLHFLSNKIHLTNILFVNLGILVFCMSFVEESAITLVIVILK